MAKIKLQSDTTPSTNENLESVVLEARKVKALEKIANSLDALTIWFEEINKSEWSDRIAYYLYEFYNIAKENGASSNSEKPFAGNVPTEPAQTEEGAELPPPRRARPKKDIEKV
jgi:hypothetical protein